MFSPRNDQIVNNNSNSKHALLLRSSTGLTAKSPQWPRAIWCANTAAMGTKYTYLSDSCTRCIRRHRHTCSCGPRWYTRLHADTGHSRTRPDLRHVTITISQLSPSTNTWTVALYSGSQTRVRAPPEVREVWVKVRILHQVWCYQSRITHIILCKHCIAVTASLPEFINHYFWNSILDT